MIKPSNYYFKYKKDKMYKPKDLIFAILPVDPDSFIEVPTVSFSTKHEWYTYHRSSDNLGGHNMPCNELGKAGIEDCELTESEFEILPDNNLADVKTRLIKLGFIYDQDFQDFIESFR